MSRTSPAIFGQSATVGGYRFTFDELRRTRSVTASDTNVDTRAVLSLGGRAHGTLTTGQNVSAQLGPSREVGIHTNWLRAEDFYVILDQQQGDTIRFQVLVKPLVNLIWLAGFVFVAGSLVALWPDAREQRRLVERLAFARA